MSMLDVGVHLNVPYRDYAALDAIRSGQLIAMGRSPLHCNTPQPERDTSAAFQLGRLAHCLILQPDLYHELYCTSPDVDRRTKDGKAQWARFEESRGSKEGVTAEQFTLADQMRAAVMAHPEAQTLLNGKGSVHEVTVLWKHQPMVAKGLPAVLCKARPDALAGNALIDLKTTRDANPKSGSFARDVWRYSYHVQMGWYCLGLAACQRQITDVYFIAVESAPPHGCAVYRLDDAAVELGMEKARELADKLVKCRADGKWPGYSTEIQPLMMPAYMQDGWED